MKNESDLETRFLHLANIVHRPCSEEMTNCIRISVSWSVYTPRDMGRFNARVNKYDVTKRSRAREAVFHSLSVNNDRNDCSRLSLKLKTDVVVKTVLGWFNLGHPQTRGENENI